MFQALVHISSAYVNSTLCEVQEYLYPAPFDVNELFELEEKLDNITLETKKQHIIKDHPNSYTFTKHLAEHEVKNGAISAAIVRPSMSMYIKYENALKYFFSNLFLFF